MSAFADNLRAARKLRGWSLQDLADHAGSITKQALSKYEQGAMRPEGATLGLLAKALGVSTDYFFRANRLELGSVEFRRKAKLTAKETDSIKEKIRDYLERYLEVEGLLGIEHKFNAPFRQAGKAVKQPVASYAEVERAADATLREWQLGTNPIPSVVETLEERGVCVLVLDTSASFNGLATHVGELPVIVLNKNDTPERRRFTALHELGHLVLDIPAATDSKEAESFCHRFASAMLLPAEVTIREFGSKRRRISDYELLAVKKQFGISAQAIMRRLRDLGIIEQSYYRYYFIKNSANRKEENFGYYRGERSESYRFRQLIYRLVAEDIVSDAKAAHLAGTTLQAFRELLIPADE